MRRTVFFSFRFWPFAGFLGCTGLIHSPADFQTQIEVINTQPTHTRTLYFSGLEAHRRAKEYCFLEEGQYLDDCHWSSLPLPETFEYQGPMQDTELRLYLREKGEAVLSQRIPLQLREVKVQPQELGPIPYNGINWHHYTMGPTFGLEGLTFINHQAEKSFQVSGGAWVEKPFSTTDPYSAVPFSSLVLDARFNRLPSGKTLFLLTGLNNYLFDNNGFGFQNTGFIESLNRDQDTCVVQHSNGRIYMIGNSTTNPSQNGTLEWIDIDRGLQSSSATSFLAPLGVTEGKRNAVCIELPDKRIFVFGGAGGFVDPNLTFFLTPPLNPESNLSPGTFVKGPNFSWTRIRPAASLGQDGKIYIYGGRKNTEDPDINRMIVFDPQANTFRPTDSWAGSNPPTCGAVSVTLPNGLILVHGGSTTCLASGNTGSLAIFDPRLELFTAYFESGSRAYFPEIWEDPNSGEALILPTLSPVGSLAGNYDRTIELVLWK